LVPAKVAIAATMLALVVAAEAVAAEGTPPAPAEAAMIAVVAVIAMLAALTVEALLVALLATIGALLVALRPPLRSLPVAAVEIGLRIGEPVARLRGLLLVRETLAVAIAVGAIVFVVAFIVVAAEGLLRLGQLRLGRGNDAEIVLGMLQIVLAGDTVARGAGVARHGQVLLQHLVCIAPHPDVRAVAVECLGFDVDVRLPGAATARPPIIRTLSHLTVTITWLVWVPPLPSRSAPTCPRRLPDCSRATLGGGRGAASVQNGSFRAPRWKSP